MSQPLFPISDRARKVFQLANQEALDRAAGCVAGDQLDVP